MLPIIDFAKQKSPDEQDFSFIVGDNYAAFLPLRELQTFCTPSAAPAAANKAKPPSTGTASGEPGGVGG